ncbi:Acyl-coa-binding domain-containing protein [Thalictrum thalictroides]|uniref:Acyl-coa-binding domain-containing protein n=1 Tax=Thalictrum thalictroides TaxID=46969 RepID=A0A7J6WHB3_THATH|nr:Acyl-coa-binding domain-containing protein [Thalictrum thalictroides]
MKEAVINLTFKLSERGDSIWVVSHVLRAFDNEVSNLENTSASSIDPKPKSIETSSQTQQETVVVEDNKDKVIAEKKKKKSVASDEDDDDWEGVEYTELDEIFSAATAFVAASAADRLSHKVSNEKQLQLYGFYKIATEGPCNTSQPSALNMSARAKWNAWQKLGSMSPEEAMQMYIQLVCELYPSWAAGSAADQSRKGRDKDAASSTSKSMMGPVFSSYVYEEDSHSEAKLEAIHECAREGEIDNLHKYIGDGESVNLKDSEGRTPLHWAVDRGHSNIVELLLSKNADVNAKDNEGQTPLHYAAMCDRDDIAELLVKGNADRDVKDNEGNSPSDLCETNSSWMQS